MDFRARPLNECDVLDFGCGWGRYTRLFLKDTPPDRIVGVDVDPEFVALSAQLLSGVKFSVVTALPPTDLPANHFDLIYAYLCSRIFPSMPTKPGFMSSRELSRLV